MLHGYKKNMGCKLDLGLWGLQPSALPRADAQSQLHAGLPAWNAHGPPACLILVLPTGLAIF
jgi:hypothetical protein